MPATGLSPCVIVMNLNSSQMPAEPFDEIRFEAEVLRSKLPVLVAFYAPWSRPCQIILSSLDEVVAACSGWAKVMRINADDNPILSLSYAVQSIPTLLYFVDGHLRARIVGTASKEAILSQLQPFFPGGISKCSPFSPSARANRSLPEIRTGARPGNTPNEKDAL
jgi:thioredoxin 1